MDLVLTVFLLSITFGFLVAFLTAETIGTKKARELPGGSLGAGIGTTLILGQYSIGFMALGAISGIIGWGIYRLLSTKE